jgi:methyltransferase (TIGR00027 family)
MQAATKMGWEVDQSENIELKQTKLRKLFEGIPAHVKFVTFDFDREKLDTVLVSHGYTADRWIFFIWEAVTQYLTETGIRNILDILAKATPGSHLTFTYLRKNFFNSRVMYGQEYLFKQFVVRNKIWLFWMDPEEVVNFLKPYGWRVVKHFGDEELAERYIKPTGWELTSTQSKRWSFRRSCRRLYVFALQAYTIGQTIYYKHG